MKTKTKIGTDQNEVAVISREEILGIPKKIFDYTVSRLKSDHYFIKRRSNIDLSKLVELSVIRYGNSVGSIGYERDETSSRLFLWVHPSYDSNYKIEISCGLFHKYVSSVSAVYEKVHISFPSSGLTLFNPDQISIILLVFEGLKNTILNQCELFRRVK